jgi:hypothetical protein
MEVYAADDYSYESWSELELQPWTPSIIHDFFRSITGVVIRMVQELPAVNVPNRSLRSGNWPLKGSVHPSHCMSFRYEEVLKKECRGALSDSFSPEVKQAKALTRSGRAVCERLSEEWSLYGANRQFRT